MSQNWTKIFATSNPVEASIVAAMLQEHHIEVVTLNKQDSSYLNFGTIEVYCHPENVITALHLIKTKPNENEPKK